MSYKGENEDKQESQRVASIAGWYINGQKDFDKQLIHLRYQSIKPYLKGPEGLELGPADGQMTQFLVNDFERLTIVDGAAELLACIPDTSNLVKVHSLFESFEPEIQFNTITMDHILEHVYDPVELISYAKKWLAPQGRMVLGVPNGYSIHRLVGVKMGLLEHPCELNPQDHILGHRRVYTRETLRADIEAAGLYVAELGGVFFKPLSNQQIQSYWTEEMIRGFYELGKDFPEYAAELYAVCEFPDGHHS